jgi:sensor domain CHASE-containing protein
VSIRSKVIALLSIVFLALVVAEWGIGEGVLLPRFEQIELEDAHTAVKRIDHSVLEALGGIQTSAVDWGNWADTYRFMADRNADFAHENLSATAMKQLHLSVLAFIDPQGRFIWSNAMDAATAAPLTLDLFASPAMPDSFPWQENLRLARSGEGLIATNHGVLMAAIAPILDGFGHGPARGMVLMGRLLTEGEVAEIGARAQTHVELAGVRSVAGAPLGTERLVKAAEMIRVFHVYDDVYGRALMTLRVDVPRTITTGAHKAVRYAMALTVAAAVAVLLLMLFVLDRTVLAPLRQVTRHAVQIGRGDDLTARLDIGRADEIGALAAEFDRMVERVADSRRQLIDHSFHAGMAELSRGVLHNIGNAMTPLAVRIAKLQERLQAIPTGDVDLALAELAHDAGDHARRADLVEFMRLTATEMNEAIKAVDEDAMVMARQASIVQTALAEQLRSTRGPNVVEATDLPTILQQSLEIVPDACRERIAVGVDASLQAVGTIRVPRTVLRLVMQNLIINAAEAIRAASKARGTVEFAAAMVESGGQPQLSLSCTDNGVGIAAENIDRVFERGYSTKAGSGNLGIGLHWCATALSALGGRIWATSPGVGHGATLHILIPIPHSTGSQAAAAA